MYIQLRNLFIKKSEIVLIERREYGRNDFYYVVLLKNSKEVDINDKEDIKVLLSHLEDRTNK